jgi:hypothetical protein
MSTSKPDSDFIHLKLNDSNRTHESSTILTEVLQNTESTRIETQENKIRRHPKLGNLYTYLYKDSTPRIAIGPQCNNLLISRVFLCGSGHFHVCGGVHLFILPLEAYKLLHKIRDFTRLHYSAAFVFLHLAEQPWYSNIT